MNSVASGTEQSRRFKPKGSFGTFEESRGGSVPPTPSTQRAAQSFAGSSTLRASSVNLMNMFHMTKASLDELEIHLKLSKFPQIFPQLFEYQIVNSGVGAVVINSS